MSDDETLSRIMSDVYRIMGDRSPLELIPEILQRYAFDPIFVDRTGYTAEEINTMRIQLMKIVVSENGEPLYRSWTEQKISESHVALELQRYRNPRIIDHVGFELKE